jgi:DNA-directed RNA polymerase II subunit RPB2
MDLKEISWNLIYRYFTDNPYNLVNHHIDSYNDFFSKGINQIFIENNKWRLLFVSFKVDFVFK